MSSRRPPDLELSPPAAMEAEEVLGALAEHVDVAAGATTRSDVVYLDTFDGRLRAAGLALERSRGSRPGTVRLTLTEPGVRDRSAEVGLPRPDRALAADVPEPIRRRIGPEIEDRALLPLVRVTSRRLDASVLDRQQKTVVRLSFESAKVHVKGRPPIPLTPRLRVTPVLGYDRDHQRVSALLEDQIGLGPAGRPLVDEAVIAAGGVPGGVSAKVAVDLAPGMRSDLAAVAICRRLAEVVEANLAGTVEDIDIEFLHDLRVAVRRARSVQKELKAVFPPAGLARARTDLRWIQEITGPTRDLDVQLAEWPALVASLAPGPAADLAPLRALLERHRAAAFAAMRRQLRSVRFRQAWAAWRDLLDQTPVDEAAGEAVADRPDALRPISEVAGRRVAAVYSHMVSAGRAIDDATPAEALHDLRKKGKELRYLLELFGRLWPADTVTPMVATLKGLQDVLGRFQDNQVQAGYLRAWGPELAGDPGGTDSLIALGLVIDRLATDQAKARRAFAERFAPFAAKPRREDVRATFDPERLGHRVTP